MALHDRRDPLWAKVIRSLYGSDGGFDFSGSFGGRVRSREIMRETWGNIIRVGRDLENLGIGFSGSFGSKIGNGRSTSFWLGNFKLCDTFS